MQLAQIVHEVGDIDFLRGISILLVLFHHFNIAYRLDDTFLPRVFRWKAVRAVARNGNYGVTMFFVISGYLTQRTLFVAGPDPAMSTSGRSTACVSRASSPACCGC